MIIADEQIVADLIEASNNLIAATARLVAGMKRDGWLNITDACVLSGLDKRKLRYQAEKGNIRTLQTGEQRGRLYSRYDCEMIRAGLAGDVNTNIKEVANP